MTILEVLKESEEEFDKEFLNPNRLSSIDQFKPELRGKLYQTFKSFIHSHNIKLLEAVVEMIPEVITGKIVPNGARKSINSNELKEFLSQTIKELK